MFYAFFVLSGWSVAGDFVVALFFQNLVKIVVNGAGRDKNSCIASNFFIDEREIVVVLIGDDRIVAVAENIVRETGDKHDAKEGRNRN